MRSNASTPIEGGSALSAEVSAPRPEAELQQLRAENERLRKDLENKEWAAQKTNEAIKLLYKELENKNKALERTIQELAQSEERFRIALKGSSIRVVNQDRELRFTWAYNLHPSFLPGDIIGKSEEELASSANRDHVNRMIQIKRQVLDTGVGAQQEMQAVVGGKVHTYDVTIEPLRDAENAVVGLTVVAVDVTERKHNEEALRQSQENYRVLAENMPQFVWIMRPDGQEEYRNSYFERYTGQTSTHGFRWSQVLHGEDDSVFKEAIKEALRHKAPCDIEFRIRRAADGQHRWHIGRLTPIRSKAGEIVKWLGTAIDIHDRKMAEEVLRDSERMQKEFVANVSHDLRTPVAAIKGFAETLLRGGLKDSKNARRFIKTIERAAERLELLIEDILALSVLESGKIGRQTEAILLAPFLNDFVKSITPVADKQRVSIQVKVDPKVKVLADKTQLHKIVLNLLSNAIKFNRRGGWIKIGCKIEGRDVHVSVADSGIGIPPADLPHIFERFYRVDKSRTHKSGNTGLGLNIVKQMIESSGGRVTVESTEGKGSTFTFTLPQAAA